VAPHLFLLCNSCLASSACWAAFAPVLCLWTGNEVCCKAKHPQRAWRQLGDEEEHRGDKPQPPAGLATPAAYLVWERCIHGIAHASVHSRQGSTGPALYRHDAGHGATWWHHLERFELCATAHKGCAVSA
jgi:hypothetical protein